MKPRSGLLVFAAFFSLATAPLFAQEQEAGSIRVAEVRYRIDGITRESVLADFLGLEVGLIFADEASLAAFVESLNRKLDNERIFDLSSLVGYELSSDGTASISVVAVDSLNALAIPLPKYSGADGFSVAVKYKDFNFLGTMEPLSANAEWFVEQGVVTVGGDFSLPFTLAGADWTASMSGDLSLGEGVTMAPNASASASGRWGADWLGLAWSWGPDLTYAYSRAYDRHTLSAAGTLKAAFDTPFGLSAYFTPSYTIRIDDAVAHTVKTALGTTASFGLAELPWSGTLSWNPGLQLYAAFDPLDVAAPDLALVADQTVTTGRVDLVGNLRKGYSITARGTWGYHFLLPLEEAQDLAVTLDGSAFLPIGSVLGCNLRVTGKWFAEWTLWGRSSSYDWGALVRGGENGLRGDLGAIGNLELPVNFAQGEFFDASMFLAEVHLVPFLDFGFVRTDPALPLSDEGSRVFRGGLDIVVYPAKARAFTYRLSVGYDLADYAATDDFKSELLEIWLGLGLHF